MTARRARGQPNDLHQVDTQKYAACPTRSSGTCPTCATWSVASAEGYGEDEIRYVRRRYLTPAAARTVAIAIADATFAARDRGLWGEGSTAVA
jgi:hypothetical protein